MTFHFLCLEWSTHLFSELDPTPYPFDLSFCFCWSLFLPLKHFLMFNMIETRKQMNMFTMLDGTELILAGMFSTF